MSDLVRRGDLPPAIVTEDRWAQAEFLMRAWLSDKAATSMRSYANDLDDFCAFLGAEDVQTALGTLTSLPHGKANMLAAAYKADLLQRPVWRSRRAREAGEKPDKHGFAPSTINRRLAALRSICKIARRFGQISWELQVDDEKHEALRDTTGVHRQDYLVIVAYLQEEAAGCAADEDIPAQARALRDLCIVRFLMDQALRRAEVVALTWPGDIDLRHSRMWLLGKGRSRDETQKKPFPMSSVSKDALKDWLELRGREPGPLFFSFSNKAQRKRLSKRGFNDLVSDIGRRAGIPNLRPHMFRHAAITRALDKTGGDVRSVAQFSRHSKLGTVMIYDDRRKQKPREIVELVAEDDDLPDDVA